MILTVKKRIFNIIHPVGKGSIASHIFDWFIIFLIVINVFIIILDTFSFTDSIKHIFLQVELWTVIIFSIEYLLRFWTADYIYPDKKPFAARIKYAFTFMAIVDLLAVLPFYLPFIFPFDLRVLRMVRLLRLLRLLKVNRYTNALTTVGNVIKRKSAQLLSSMYVVSILMVIASVLMYSIENEAQPEVFSNAFTGLWWAVATLTTVGYGDIYPVTAIGKVLGTIIALLGIGLVAVPTGIISAGFIEEANRENQEHNEEKHFCPYCGNKIK